MLGCALVLAGGDPVPPAIRDQLPKADLVIAADSGVALAEILGLKVDRIVGDLDSACVQHLDAARAAGAVVECHPAEKDATDLELAIDAAADAGAQRIVVVGGSGGRVDHFLANMLLLGARKWQQIAIEGRFGPVVTVVHGGRGARSIHGAPGDLVTLLPVGGAARGVVTSGLQYRLRREDLVPGTSRGVSNVFTIATATVELDGGTLLVVQPEPTTGERA